MSKRSIAREEFLAKVKLGLAARSSRNQSLLDKLCRRIMLRVTQVPIEHDFMRDSLIDNDQGFDPDELERYQNGE